MEEVKGQALEEIGSEQGVTIAWLLTGGEFGLDGIFGSTEWAAIAG